MSKMTLRAALVLATIVSVPTWLVAGPALAQSSCEGCLSSRKSIYKDNNPMEYCQRIAACPAPPVQGQNPPPPDQPAPPGAMAVGTCVTVDQPSVRGQAGRIIQLTPGGYFVQGDGKAPSQAQNWVRADVHPGPCPTKDVAVGQSCFPSDADGAGGAGLEQNVRSVIRQIYEHGPAVGQDGAVTIAFQSVQMGAPRAWQVSDGFNFSADQSKPVYDLLVGFTTCTDYKAKITKIVQQRAFECFTAPGGALSCQTSNAVAVAPDQTTDIPKF
jgi:hypothetical protein